MTSRPKMKCYVNSFSTVVFTESQYNKSKKLIKKKKKKRILMWILGHLLILSNFRLKVCIYAFNSSVVVYDINIWLEQCYTVYFDRVNRLINA